VKDFKKKLKGILKNISESDSPNIAYRIYCKENVNIVSKNEFLSCLSQGKTSEYWSYFTRAERHERLTNLIK
jgi:hypothetical protein